MRCLTLNRGRLSHRSNARFLNSQRTINFFFKLRQSSGTTPPKPSVSLKQLSLSSLSFSLLTSDILRSHTTLCLSFFCSRPRIVQLLLYSTHSILHIVGGFQVASVILEGVQIKNDLPQFFSVASQNVIGRWTPSRIVPGQTRDLSPLTGQNTCPGLPLIVSEKYNHLHHQWRRTKLMRKSPLHIPCAL